MVSQDLIKGEGAEVKDTQTVVAHYTGWLLDGTQFDSSWDRGKSSTFSLDGVIKGWKQGLAGHTVGSPGAAGGATEPRLRQRGEG